MADVSEKTLSELTDDILIAIGACEKDRRIGEFREAGRVAVVELSARAEELVEQVAKLRKALEG